MKKILSFILLIAALSMLFTACTKEDNKLVNVNGFTTEFGTIVNYEGKTNVIKINRSDVNGVEAVRYSLAEYFGKEVTVRISADVRREGNKGDITWRLNRMRDPTIAFIENAEPGIWYNISKEFTLNLTSSDPYLFLSIWAREDPNTSFYIANPTITVISEKNITPLYILFEKDFLFGNILDYHSAWRAGDTWGIDHAIYHHNVITPWFSTIVLAPPNKGEAYLFTDADRLVDFLLNKGVKVFGHTLIDMILGPAWLTEGSREDVMQNMKDYITTVLNNFKGKIYAWNVVNEGLRYMGLTAADARGDWRNCINEYFYDSPNQWFQKLGADYIEMAFRFAREADPDITLYYNEIFYMNLHKVDVTIKMIQDINDRYKKETGGTRNLIEGIGWQGHIYDYKNINYDVVREILDKLINLGIEIAISEIDISMVGQIEGPDKDSVMSEEDELTQAIICARLFQIFNEYSDHITRITFWGADDGYSWISLGNPTLFDRNFNPKLAFHAVNDPDGFLAQYDRR